MGTDTVHKIWPYVVLRKMLPLLEYSITAQNKPGLGLINEASSANYSYCGYACILLDWNTKICMCFSSCACLFNLKDQLQKKFWSYSWIMRMAPVSLITFEGWFVSTSNFLLFIASTLSCTLHLKFGEPILCLNCGWIWVQSTWKYSSH